MMTTLGYAQNNMIIPKVDGQKTMVNQGSTIQIAPCAGSINALGIEENWGISIRNYGVFNHTSAVDQDQFKALKIEANARRNDTPMVTSQRQNNAVEAPALGKSWCLEDFLAGSMD